MAPNVMSAFTLDVFGVGQKSVFAYSMITFEPFHLETSYSVRRCVARQRSQQMTVGVVEIARETRRNSHTPTPITPSVEESSIRLRL